MIKIKYRIVYEGEYDVNPSDWEPYPPEDVEEREAEYVFLEDQSILNCSIPTECVINGIDMFEKCKDHPTVKDWNRSANRN